MVNTIDSDRTHNGVMRRQASTDQHRPSSRDNSPESGKSLSCFVMITSTLHISVPLWVVNVGEHVAVIQCGKCLTTFQVTPHAECMRGDLKCCGTFATVRSLQLCCDHHGFSIFNRNPIGIYAGIHCDSIWFQCKQVHHSASHSPGHCSFKSLAPCEISLKFYIGNFRATFSNSWLRYLLWNCPEVIVIRPHWWQVNIGSGNGLVLSGSKTLFEPMLIQIYATWCH